MGTIPTDSWPRDCVGKKCKERLGFMESNFYLQLASAVVAGLLVGIQRERAAKSIAGIRTFPLIALLGFLCGNLSDNVGGWLVVIGLVATAALLVLGNVASIKKGNIHVGLTTEFSVLVIFIVGTMMAFGLTGAGLAVTGIVAVLLHWKQPMHEIASRTGEDEFQAIIRFVLVALVVLPVLPNRAFGPFQVLNPFEIWLMVVLILGIGLAAYVGYKILGARAGTLLSGVLGGMISSTATTVSFARRSRKDQRGVGLAGVVVMIASTTVIVRVLLELALIAPDSFSSMAPPLALMMLVMGTISIAAYLLQRGKPVEISSYEDPADLGTALGFGLLYAVVIFAVAGAKEWFGEGGLFVVSALSGLTDMDAITLSTAQLVKTARLDVEIGWRLILVAAMANLVFKTLVVAILGHRRLLAQIWLPFALSLLAGIALLRLWPAYP